MKKNNKNLKLLFFSLVTIALILFLSSVGFNLLWRKILYFHATQVSDQIKINLVKEISEGNLFEISASLGRLRMAKIFDEVALLEYSPIKTEWLYSSSNGFREFLVLKSGDLPSCDKNIVQIPNKDIILIGSLLKKERLKDELVITCAIVQTKIPNDLKQVHSLVFYIFSVISFFLIGGLAFFIARFGNQELINQKVLAEEQIRFASKVAEIAQQVSHDIRSPLSALNMMLMDLKELPEQKRVIVRSALQRINDISNSLLEKSKAPPTGSIPAQSAPSPLAIPPAGAMEVVLMSSMVGELLSEKRIQFREKIGVSIEEDLTKAYGYFASVNATELKRVLSNLINNSIEAFPEGTGRVTVGIRGYKDVVQIIVSDNGKGIPAFVLAKLGERGVSHGKESSGNSGSGLGVYHAKSTVEAYGGKFEIQSREGQGTMIQIQLPRVSAPDWFVEELRLKPDMSVFSVDDDSSIHGIWSECLGAIGAEKQGVSLKSYTSTKAFVDIYEGLAPEARANALFLVDYEFLNQGVNGLQVIEKLGIASQAILVTSRYEEVDLQKKCQGMGVKLIPKALAGYVPIVVA